MGIGSLALTQLLSRDGLLAAPPEKPPLEQRSFDLLPKASHFEPKAESMISIFMGGGPSHIDMFDPKPVLEKYHGQVFPGSNIKYDNAGGASSTVLASPFKFRQYGQAGMDVSELLPHFSGIVDDVTLVRSMNLGGIRNHVAGMRAMNSGRQQSGRAAIGSWLTYGLGSDCQDLPAYVSMVPYSNPPGSPYWSSGPLPSIYQGTVVRSKEPRIANLEPPSHLKGKAQQEQLSLLRELNREHLEAHPGELDLEARIASYELAARMQTSAKEVTDLSGESEATRKLYGLDDDKTRRIGECCLIARRLVERGVRFVQIWYYGWDMHDNIFERLQRACAATDKPTAGLVRDLKSRGMLEKTLVHWGGEMGRLPVIQNAREGRDPGRDHNTDGFSMWLAGGGIKSGSIYGATDDFGHKAVIDPIHHSDYHATLLKLFGFDHKKLSYLHNGRQLTLTDGQSGQIIQGILS